MNKYIPFKQNINKNIADGFGWSILPAAYYPHVDGSLSTYFINGWGFIPLGMGSAPASIQNKKLRLKDLIRTSGRINFDPGTVLYLRRKPSDPTYRLHRGTDIYTGGTLTNPFPLDYRFKGSRTTLVYKSGHQAIIHNESGISLRFLHLSRLPSQPVGAFLKPGEAIGIIGGVGAGGRVHLHMECYYSPSPSKLPTDPPQWCRGESIWIPSDNCFAIKPDETFKSGSASTWDFSDLLLDSIYDKGLSSQEAIIKCRDSTPSRLTELLPAGEFIKSTHRWKPVYTPASLVYYRDSLGVKSVFPSPLSDIKQMWNFKARWTLPYEKKESYVPRQRFNSLIKYV